MTNQSKLNAFFTAMATIASMKPSNEVEFEVVKEAQEFFMNPMYASLQKQGFEKNFFAVDKFGNPFSTVKGFNMLFEQPKVVTKLQTKPVEKMKDSELISNFVEVGNELCKRIPHTPILQKKIKANYNELYDTSACVVENINNLVVESES